MDSHDRCTVGLRGKVDMRVTILLLLIICISCANLSGQHGVVLVKIVDILESPYDYDGRFVIVSGCMNRNEYGDAVLHKCGHANWSDSGKFYIDIFPLDDIDLPFDESLGIELCGRFRGYSSSFLGMGWLTSEVGLIEVSRECGHVNKLGHAPVTSHLSPGAGRVFSRV